jgi:radical SAM protein with 4Fe4S-binding SPASM domain
MEKYPFQIKFYLHLSKKILAHLFDIFNFISKLSLYKLYNALLIYSTFYISQFLKKPILWGLPFTLSFEPTTTCNLSCPECPSGLKNFTRKIGDSEWEKYQKWINEVHSHLIYLYLYFQGEPFMNKDFCKMIKAAHDKNIYTVTSTNGHFLTTRVAEEVVASGLDRLIISIDGSTQEVYEQYRKGGKLDKVLQGTQNMIDAKRKLNSKKPFIIFQMLVVAPNEHQIEEVKAIGKKMGVDKVILKTAQIYDFERGNELIPKQDKYSRYKKRADGSYIIKNEMKNQCWKLWHSAVSTFDGQILPCCFDKDAQYTMGKWDDAHFHSIWKSKNYDDFRQKLLLSRSQIDICKNCSEGTKVWESI